MQWQVKEASQDGQEEAREGNAVVAHSSKEQF